MSMRIVTPRGVVKKVDKVCPFAEASTYINNRRKYIFEPAKKLQYATGVVLVVENMGFGMENTLIIGNLKNATVREIIHTLAEKEFYDFSDFKYQEAEFMTDVIIDGGMKPPYCSDFTKINDLALHQVALELSSPCTNGMFANTFGGCSELPFPTDDYVDCTTTGEDDLLKALAGEGEDDFTDDGGEENCD